MIFQLPFRFTISSGAVDQYSESQENDVEVDFTGQRLTRTMPHSRQCDTHEAEEDSIQERRAQPRGVEMT